MMNMLRLLTASTAVLLVGCGAPSLGPTVASTSGCPTDGWDAAVIWSSESAPSQLDYVRGDAVVDSRALPYQGLEPAPAEAPFRQGPDAWLVANGNTTRDSTHVLRWSQADWSTTAHRVDEQVIWSVVADDDAFYTTNTVNAEAQVRRRTPDGQLTGEARIPSTVFSSLALDGDRLHAVGSTGEPGTEQTVLITFDATTLAEENRVILGPSSFPVSTLVHEVVAESTNYLTFAHTLLNPAFRAMDEYRAVTLFDPDSRDPAHGCRGQRTPADRRLGRRPPRPHPAGRGRPGTPDPLRAGRHERALRGLHHAPLRRSALSQRDLDEPSRTVTSGARRSGDEVVAPCP